MIPLKENLALQDVALLIKNEDGDLERANAYLNYSLNDALEYNNRLRILEIGKKLPAIATAYQETVLVKKQTTSPVSGNNRNNSDNTDHRDSDDHRAKKKNQEQERDFVYIQRPA